jgi:tetratricopeptide (TPR) repeat protein
LLLIAFQSKAENNIMYDKANQLYHNKNYDSAAQLYQQMIYDGYCYADLYYNAGNAYYRLNKIGLAIWNYKKALQLQYNKNYSDNLSLAKKRIREPIENVQDIFFIRWWQGMYQLFTVNTWALFALTFFLLSFLLLFIKKIKTSFTSPQRITAILFALSGYSLCMMTAGAYNDTYHYCGIVIEPKTLCTLSTKKEPIFVSEGIEVKVIETNITTKTSANCNYILVQLPDGREGLIDKKSIKKI